MVVVSWAVSLMLLKAGNGREIYKVASDFSELWDNLAMKAAAIPINRLAYREVEAGGFP